MARRFLLFMLGAIIVATLSNQMMPSGLRLLAAEVPAKHAGTYRIDTWQEMEEQKLFHFFYLHHSGDFLLAAEWPGREESRAVGTWRKDGNHLTLHGQMEVKTNKGTWKTPFNRTFKVELRDVGITLVPVLRKNRFGLLGWPNVFVFHRTAPAPNLPTIKIPKEEQALLALITSLRQTLR